MNTGPVAELAPIDVWMRGTEAQAARLSNSDEAEIVSNIVRGFYRPISNASRIIAEKPLANEHSRYADSVIASDPDRAETFVRAIAHPRVCRSALAAPGCSGNRSTGILRFSRAYAIANDTAVIHANYFEQRSGMDSEIRFTMVRRADGWHMASRRTVNPPQPEAPLSRTAATALLETDRAYGVASRGTDVVTALSAMFHDSVIVQVPGGFATGKDAAVAALRANPDNERSHVTWTPVRVGIAADRRNGFTYGYMTLVRPDGTRVPLKYLAYWVIQAGEWKVLAYKRRPRPAGDVSMEVLPPALPVGPNRQSQVASLQSLEAAEKEFSDTAQVIGIGPAFEKYGRVDAMNMGGPSDTAFVIGNVRVARSVGAGSPAGSSPVSWAADYRRVVASSGDMGVTFGYIRPNTPPPAGQPTAIPFFTIWKRDPGQPWRYVAE